MYLGDHSVKLKAKMTKQATGGLEQQVTAFNLAEYNRRLEELREISLQNSAGAGRFAREQQDHKTKSLCDYVDGAISEGESAFAKKKLASLVGALNIADSFLHALSEDERLFSCVYQTSKHTLAHLISYSADSIETGKKNIAKGLPDNPSSTIMALRKRIQAQFYRPLDDIAAGWRSLAPMMEKTDLELSMDYDSLLAKLPPPKYFLDTARFDNAYFATKAWLNGETDEQQHLPEINVTEVMHALGKTRDTLGIVASDPQAFEQMYKNNGAELEKALNMMLYGLVHAKSITNGRKADYESHVDDLQKMMELMKHPILQEMCAAKPELAGTMHMFNMTFADYDFKNALASSQLVMKDSDGAIF